MQLLSHVSETVKAKKKDSQQCRWLSIIAPTPTVEGERQVLLPLKAT
jgi:hypothetical protein